MTDKRLIDILDVASTGHGEWSKLEQSRKRELIDAFDYGQRRQMIQEFNRLPDLVKNARELADCIATNRVTSAKNLLEKMNQRSAREAELNR